MFSVHMSDMYVCMHVCIYACMHVCTKSTLKTKQIPCVSVHAWRFKANSDSETNKQNN